MPFNTEIRNKLASMVGNARQLLRKEFQEQLQELYGIQPDGRITPIQKLTYLDDEQLAVALLLRQGIEYLESSEVHKKNPTQKAIDRFLHEQSFTILNRFTALRLCEERGIIQECLRSGTKSKGFQVYLQIAGSGIGDTFQRYKTFLLILFDEIAVDLGILFDRFSREGILFPREMPLIHLLEIMNDPTLNKIWIEDETIGWIYQYFNSKEEREEMRKASGAPRNSRELAVRNQFFTPRYVVKFLSDNTLGRIWYEMQKGKTHLKEHCKYLVTKPNEIFVDPGESFPAERVKNENKDLNQKEILDEICYIAHRNKKDPRDIKILDPACGSGHFLLYVFGLLLLIYEEAWKDSDKPRSEISNKSLRDDYKSIDELRQDLPILILKFNLYGIDIDRRACQIATLALWLKAQRYYNDMKIRPLERPFIEKTNIVVAEPMPGDEEQKNQFIETIKEKNLSTVFELVVKEMRLLGEAGSLLKLENHIKKTVKEEIGELGEIFFEEETARWRELEINLINALKSFSELANNTKAYQARLFSNDAIQGFAFIDLCRNGYDVILMNPPFGDLSMPSKKYIKAQYPYTHRNIASAFVERSLNLLKEDGFFGAIIDTATSIRSSYQDYRTKVFYPNAKITCYCHLGWEVLDANVETCCFTARKKDSNGNDTICCFDLSSDSKKEDKLRSIIRTIESDQKDQKYYIVEQSEFAFLPNAAINFTLQSNLRRLFKKEKPLDPFYAEVRTGLSSGDNERFYKLRWEVPASLVGLKDGWPYLSNGGDFSPFYRNWQEVIDWRNEGNAIKELKLPNGKRKSRPQNLSYIMRSGLTYGKRGKYLSVQPHPSGRIFTNEGQGIFPYDEKNYEYLLALLNSRLIRALINEYCGQHKENGYVSLIPIKSMNPNSMPYFSELSELSQRATSIIRNRLRWSIEHSESIGLKLFNSEGEVFHNSENYLSDLEKEINIKCEELDCIEKEINDRVNEIYELDSEDKNYIYQKTKDMPSLKSVIAPNNKSKKHLAHELIDYVLGCLFGRWDIRISLNQIETPRINDSFSDLPLSPPGFLKRLDGENCTIVPKKYPIEIEEKGILVCDPNNPRDILKRLIEVLECIFPKSLYIDQELSKILDFTSLAAYLRNSNGFFQNHLNLYAKGSRKAPIYLPLSTKSESYKIWLYYPEINTQTLFISVSEFLNPKIEEVSRDIDKLEETVLTNKTLVKREELEKLFNFKMELENFRNELLKIAEFPYKPNLNDGVMITVSPFWKLFQNRQWKNKLKNCWQKLEDGEYDWAHLAYSIWPERVREKCKSDKSLAIAHGLEDLYKGS